MSYALRLAGQSLWHDRWINLLSMLAISMGLLVMSLVSALLYNTHLFVKKLPEKFFVVAYLKDGLNEKEAQDILSSLKQDGSVEQARYVSKAEALKELKGSLKDADYILEGLDENPLPASIEIRLRRENVAPESIQSFVSGLKKISNIEDVQYGEKFLMSIHSVKIGLETVGIILTIIIVTGIVFVCYSTVKILFYRRRDEIETLKLLGATRGFVRAPFLIEGAVLGIGGGIVSLVIILAFYYGVFYRLSATIPLLRSAHYPPELMLSLPLAGIFLGITGAYIAMGRIRY